MARIRLGEREYYASDYFDRLYTYAVQLIQSGVAYVDSLSAEEIRRHRGTLTEPGNESPYRNRSAEENLDLFERMRAGEFAEWNERVLRAKIDMAHPEYKHARPRHVPHPPRKLPITARGDKWCIYPMYDFTHGQSDAIENGSPTRICTLEFEEPPSSLRLVPGPTSPSRAAPSIRYEFARLAHQLHDHEQAKAPGARGG